MQFGGGANRSSSVNSAPWLALELPSRGTVQQPNVRVSELELFGEAEYLEAIKTYPIDEINCRWISNLEVRTYYIHSFWASVDIQAINCSVSFRAILFDSILTHMYVLQS